TTHKTLVNTRSGSPLLVVARLVEPAIRPRLRLHKYSYWMDNDISPDARTAATVHRSLRTAKNVPSSRAINSGSDPPTTAACSRHQLTTVNTPPPYHPRADTQYKCDQIHAERNY